MQSPSVRHTQRKIRACWRRRHRRIQQLRSSLKRAAQQPVCSHLLAAPFVAAAGTAPAMPAAAAAAGAGTSGRRRIQQPQKLQACSEAFRLFAPAGSAACRAASGSSAGGRNGRRRPGLQAHPVLCRGMQRQQAAQQFLGLRRGQRHRKSVAVCSARKTSESINDEVWSGYVCHC